MARSSNTFRVFVSSTFSDFEVERNALHRDAFPKLQELCANSGARFQAIDLRWGVSAAASHDQRTMEICLNEIARCQKATPRPNFILLLGDRYGWRPLPSHIPRDEFERIQARVPAARRLLLDTWYALDYNAVPPTYDLHPRTGIYRDYSAWSSVENELRSAFLDVLDDAQIEMGDRLKYDVSATEQEIIEGILRAPNKADHVFCFFRSIHGLSNDENAARFVDLKEDGSPDHEARAKIERVKTALQQLLPENIDSYRAIWTGTGITNDHISQLCIDVVDRLGQVIRSELDKNQTADPLETEIADHLAFGAQRAAHFTGRTAVLDAIRAYAAGMDRRPLVVNGPSGAGKTALMAYAARRCDEWFPGSEIVVRFVGVTPASSDARLLLESLIRDVTRRYRGQELDIPTAYNELVAELPSRLTQAAPNHRLVIFIDALDQLAGTGLTDTSSWLPFLLPDHVRVVVSTSPGECLSRLSNALPADRFVQIEAMLADEAGALLNLWLRDAHRTLGNHQRSEVLAKFAANGLPLYLKLVFEEARHWKSYAGQEATILCSDIDGAIRDHLRRLASKGEHGQALVSHVLGYLAAAKNGLAEDELLDLLGCDREVLEEFYSQTRHRPPEETLPLVIWSRLHLDLAPFLTERSADGASLLNFYHRQLSSVAIEDYLSGDERVLRHRALASYFRLAPPRDDAKPVAKMLLRKLSELSYHQALGDMWEELYATLTDFSFLESKAREAGIIARRGANGEVANVYTGVFQLQDDFALALRRWPAGPHPDFRIRRQILGEFASAIGREAHVFVNWPELLWQQLHNRLQWSTGGSSRLVDRTAATSSRWLWLRTPLPDSDALIRTLAAHKDQVRDCAISSDQTFIVSVGDDDFVRIWDRLSGDLRFNLSGHTSHVHGCTISPDNRWLVSASNDGTLKIWDARTGSELMTLTGHAARVDNCTVSRDATFIVSQGLCDFKVWDTRSGRERASLEDHQEGRYTIKCAISADDSFIVTARWGDPSELTIWDSQTGLKRSTLKGHTEKIRDFAISNDQSFIASVGEDKTARIWDVDSGKLRATLTGHTEWIDSCAISPDGEYVVTASDDLTVRVWNVATGAERAVLCGHTRSPFYCCTFSPDGSFFVTAGADMTLRIWDAHDFVERAVFSGHTGAIKSIAISRDSSFIVSASVDHSIKVWDANAQTTAHSHTPRHARRVYACDISPDGTFAVSSSGDKTLKIWDLSAATQRATLTGHDHFVLCCAISPDSTGLTSGSADKTLILWDVKSGRETATLSGHTDWVHSCRYSPDGSFIVSGSDHDHHVIVWDVRTLRRRLTLNREGYVFDTTFPITPDSRHVVTTFGSQIHSHLTHTLRIWDVRDGSSRSMLSGHTDTIRTTAISPDGRFAVTASSDKTLKSWDLTTGTNRATFRGHPHWVFNCAVSPDGDFIVSTSGNQSSLISDINPIKIWDAKTGLQRATLWGHTDHIVCLNITPDARFIVSAARDQTLRIWDAQNGIGRAMLPLAGVPTCAALHPFRPIIVCGDEGGIIYIIELKQLHYGALIVTPKNNGRGLWTNCPKCQTPMLLTHAQLGQQMDCPRRQCSQPIKINSSVIDTRCRPAAGGV